MKEATGGTFMIYVLLVFLAVYIIFIAVAFNYARAFRVKNKVIDIIEQNEGINLGDLNDIKKINAYLTAVSYKVKIAEDDCGEMTVDKNNLLINTDRGYCIGVSESNASGEKVYKVRTFVTIDFPFIEGLNIKVPITGETRRVKKINAGG